jgi:alpha-tubulin suppressor-like RCC1 family protein
MTPSSSVPVQVWGGMTFKALTVGDGSACGVTSTATAYCWGDNAWGQLGNGTTAGPERCGDGDACSTIPVAVVGGLTFETVTTAAAFGWPGHQTCGVTASHAAYCWGANDNGQLGNGVPGGADTPVPVAGGLRIQSVGVGANFACGLTEQGVTYCWGANDFGQLGNGTNTVSTTPVAIPGLAFAMVSVGYHAGCGVRANGAAYCWGANDHGQLGDGTTTSRGSPVQVVGSGNGEPLLSGGR